MKIWLKKENKIANTRKKWKNPCCKKSKKPSSVCQFNSSLENTFAPYAGLYNFIVSKENKYIYIYKGKKKYICVKENIYIVEMFVIFFQ